MHRALHVAGNLAPLVAGLVTAPLTARALGPTGRGEVAIIVVVSTILMTVAALGLPWLARSDLAADPLSLSFWRRQARIVGLALIPVAIVAAVVLSASLGLEVPETAALCALLIMSVLAAARGIEANALITMGKPGRFGIANLAGACLSLIAIVVAFVQSSLSVAVVLWASVASMVLQVTLTVVLVSRATRLIREQLHERERQLRELPEFRGRALMSRASRAWGAQLGEAAAIRGDVLSISTLAPTSQVGLYSVVALLPQAAYAVYTTIVQASYARGGATSEGDRFRNVLQTSLGAAVAIAVVAGPIAWWALPIVFGPEFTASREYLPAAIGMTIALGATAPVIQRMSGGRASVVPLGLILLAVAIAVAVSSLFVEPPVSITVLAAVLLLGSLSYAVAVTRGDVLNLRPKRIVQWWRGGDDKG